MRNPLLNRPWRIQRWLYLWGYRPKRGSVLYSPSLSTYYGFEDALKGNREE